MHDGVPYDPIQGQGEGHRALKFQKLHFSMSFAIYNSSW